MTQSELIAMSFDIARQLAETGVDAKTAKGVLDDAYADYEALAEERSGK
tara:strand:+ start:22954 stop:23100 length:147 start_codon:yes stop_codon:yes gene_type:complete